MKQISATAIALGGEEIQVTFPNGNVETVKVLLLKIKQLPMYLSLLEDELALAAFLCGKDAEWSEAIVIQSILDIIELGHALNFDAARRWVTWRAEMTQTANELVKSHPALSPKSPT